MADRVNQLQTRYFLLHRRREEGDRTDLGRDYEGAKLCQYGGDCRLYEVIAINTYSIPFLFPAPFIIPNRNISQIQF